MAANPLARPLAIPLDDTLRARLADATLPQLERHWRASDGAFPRSLRAVETARLALVANTPSAGILDDATTAAAQFLFHEQNDARQALDTLLQPAMQRLRALAAHPGVNFLLVAADCAERLGDTGLLNQVLDECTDLKGDAFTTGAVLLRQGNRHSILGNQPAALAAFTEAASLLQKAGALRERAILLGKIADIHYARGELDEALRIRIDEQLPVFEKLGDVRERAVTLGRIADIHYCRGELDAALRIRMKEQLPVFDKLGDVRERAVTLGKIADIHYARRELDAALRILIEELLPAFEKLGDVRLRVVTLGKVAQIYHVQGDLDRALMLNEQRRHVAEKSEALHSLAHIGFLSAQIRLQRGDHQRGELQAIHDDLAKSFAINCKLEHPNGIGAVGVLLAHVLALGGLKDEALEILKAAEQAWTKLGNTQGIAHIATLRARIAGPH